MKMKMKKRIPNPFNGKKKDKRTEGQPLYNAVDQPKADRLPFSNHYITTDLDGNLDFIQDTLGNSSDLVSRKFRLGDNGEYSIAVIYTDGLANSAFIQDFILEAIIFDMEKVNFSSLLKQNNLYDVIKARVLPMADLKEITNFQELFSHVLSGNTVLILDGFHKGFAISSKGGAKRSVQEPTSQTVVRGPKDGFTETLRTNTALIRRRIKDTNLR